MTILDADEKFPVHCANIPGDKWLTHEGGDKAFQGGPTYFQKAVASAKALAKKLGPGWTGFVHYNLGWHPSAKSPKKTLQVYGGEQGYSSLFTAGSMFVGRGRTPRAAVKSIVRQMEKHIADQQAMLEDL